MMLGLNRIVMRIWLPFAGVLLICLLAVAWYYPRRQADLYREATLERITEVARAIALSVELSLEHDAFEGVQRSVRLVSKAEDFAHVALVQHHGSASDTVFSTNPPDVPAEEVLNYIPTELLVVRHPVVSELFNGYVQVAVSEARIEAGVKAINAPVYRGLLLIMLVSLVMLLAVARSIAWPLVKLRSAANALGSGDYSTEVPVPAAATEVQELAASLESLRRKLEEARDQNREFNERLEREIELRTRDLERTQSVLIEAQRVALLGNFQYDDTTGLLAGSEMFRRILGGGEEGPVGPEALARVMGERAADTLRSMLRDTIISQHRTQQDIQCKGSGDTGTRWLAVTLGPVPGAGPDDRMVLGTVQDITARKRIEEDVRRLSMVARRTSNAVVITDVDRRMTWVNDALLRMTGYELHEVLGRTPAMFQFNGTEPATKELIDRSLRELKEVNTSVLNRGKDGREYWLQLNIVPLFGEQSEHVGFMAVEADITERVRSSAALETSRNMFRALVENLPGATFHEELGPQPRTLFMSAQVELITGVNASAFISGELHRADLIHPDDRADYESAVQQAIGVRAPYRHEYRLVAGGVERWVRESSQVYSDGTGLLRTGTLIDITVEREAGLVARHSAELIVALAEASSALLTEPDLYTGAGRGFALFGSVLGLDRVCLFKHVRDAAGHVSGAGPVLTWQRLVDGGGERLLRPEFAPAPAPAFGPLLATVLEGRAYSAKVEDIDHRALATFMRSQGVTQVLSLPIITPQGIWGFLCLDHMGSSDRWQDGDKRTIETFVSALAQSLERDQRMAELEAMTRFPDGDPNPVLRVSTDGRLLYANRASFPVLKAMGMQLGEPVPTSLQQRLRDKGEGDNAPMELDAGPSRFSLLCVPLHKFGFYNIYGTDVTAMHQLRAMQDEVIQQERMSVLGRLTASIAHEVNSPLGAVLGASKNLASALGDSLFSQLPRLGSKEMELLLELSRLPMVPPDHAVLRTRTAQVRARLKELQVGDQRLAWAERIAEMGWGLMPGEPWERLLDDAAGQPILESLHSLFEMKESLRTIDFAATRAAKVVNALRTYIHQEEDRKPREFDLAAQLRSVTTLFKASGRKGLSIEVHLPEVIQLTGVEDDLAQVWTNILSNAVQAIGESGSITVSHRELPDAWVVEIANDGPMIPPEVQARMYDPLFTTKKKGEGTGIGLNLVKRIVEAHGGQILCDSSHHSTIFAVQLPRLNA